MSKNKKIQEHKKQRIMNISGDNTGKAVSVISYIYLCTPLILFTALWLRPLLAVLLTAALLYGIYASIRREEVYSPDPGWMEDKRTYLVLVLALAIICMWVLTSGIGASMQQYPDHLYRNALYKILVDYSWPVRLDDFNNSPKVLTYYIGFWLPAALVAKASSYAGGFLFMQIWAILGLMLIYYFICEKQGSWKLWYLIVFILFGGADPIGRLITGAAFTQEGNRYEWWAVIFNYPGVCTSLFWVYNQVIYAWLIYCMITRQKNNKNLLFIYCNALLNCTFPAVGMIPFVIYQAMHNSGSRRLREALLSCNTTQNYIGLVMSLLLSAYTLANDAIRQNLPTSALGTVVYGAEQAENTYESISVSIDDTFNSFPITTRIMMYLWFILLEFGLYYFIIYKSEKHKPITWITLGVLLVCPWIKVGGWMDFCMRASIPALFCLYELVLSAIQKYFKIKDYFRLGLLICMLFISSITTVDTLMGVMKPMDLLLYDGNRATPEQVNTPTLAASWNFTGTEDAFFYKYLAKRTTEKE